MTLERLVCSYKYPSAVRTSQARMDRVKAKSTAKNLVRLKSLIFLYEKTKVMAIRKIIAFREDDTINDEAHDV